MSDYELRLLDPATEQHLFREAFDWRSPKSHVQPDRMPFKEFAKVCDTQLTVGLFNGELQAVYHLIETEPSVYEAHFTTRRGLSREIALLGAKETARLLLENGASQIDAWVTMRSPLRKFLEELGFSCVTVQHFTCAQDEDVSKLSANRNQRLFVKYSLQVDDHRIKRPETSFQRDDHF